MKTLITFLACLVTVPASAQTLEFISTHNLPSQLSYTSGNFHPQGLGIDEANERLVYAQQNTSTIWSSDLDGSDVSVLSTAGASHVTSVAMWAGELFYSEYSGNGGGLDMYRTTPPTNSRASYSTYTAAYGGFPIDIREGTLYRTNLWSSSYTWANLYQVVVADVDAPNSVTRTMNLSDTNGIGDIAVDVDSNSLWVLEYATNARIHQYDLDTGVLQQTYTAIGDGQDAGLTYYDGRLYHYDWVSGSGSTLTVFATGFAGSRTCTDGMDPVDIDEDGDDDSCIHPTADIGDYVTIEPGARIHANAVIAPRAIIGNNAVIGAGAIVGRRAEVRGTLGAGVVLGRSASVGQESTVGSGTTIGYGSNIGNSVIGPNATIGNLVDIFGSDVGDDGGLGLVVVARSTTIQSTNVGSLTVVGPACDLDTTNIGASVRIRKEASFAFGSVVNDGARIGRNADIGSSATIVANARIGANAIVSSDSCPAGDVARGVTDSTPCP